MDFLLALFPDVPLVQSGENFYSHSTKCKKCYIWLQQDRQRRARNGEVLVGRPPAAASSSSSFSASSSLLSSSRRSRSSVSSSSSSSSYSSSFSSRRRSNVAALRDAASGALLGLPARPPPRAGSAEEAVALRAAAVAAAYGTAIAGEVAALCPVASLELSELPVSLLQLAQTLKSALARAAAAAPSERAAAACAALWALAEKRLEEGSKAVRAAAREAEAMGACPCGRVQDATRNVPPVICSECVRVFHATCAGFPDELYVCAECAAGVPVVRFDEVRGDVFVMEEKRPGVPDDDADSLGKMLWNAQRNQKAIERTSIL